MKPTNSLISFGAAVMCACASIPASGGVKELISARNVDVHIADSLLVVTADLVLDSLDLKSNRQVLITPIVESGERSEESKEGRADSIRHSVALPSVLINGRNMHYSYERGVLRSFPALKNQVIAKELQRRNGKAQTVEYTARVAVEPWMKEKGTEVSFRYDPCGCGVASAPEIYKVPVPEEEEILMPPPELVTNRMLNIPEIDVPNVQVHAGRARIQFEVDRTALHIEPYKCRNGQLIDNREQLQIIDDSVRYALSDPNVELVGIEICGYASPESPYLHNEELANGRSKVLAEYLADRYNIPRDKALHSAVTENWGEFREMVVASDEITEQQRSQLLKLIDSPATTPEEYDRKERILKTDPKFASLYKKLILPVWFPKLRATTFVLKTQLKEMDDRQLKEAFRTSPDKMSLQQLCRVASQYPADSDEFNEVVLTALEKYPDDQIAIVNAAIAAVAREEYDRAMKLLDRAEQTPEVENLRGLIREQLSTINDE